VVGPVVSESGADSESAPSEATASELRVVWVGEVLGSGAGEWDVGEEEACIAFGPGVSPCTGQKPVPSAGSSLAGSSLVPSPLFDFSDQMAITRRVSNAKSLVDDAICFDISHGENAFHERV